MIFKNKIEGLQWLKEIFVKKLSKTLQKIGQKIGQKIRKKIR